MTTIYRVDFSSISTIVDVIWPKPVVVICSDSNDRIETTERGVLKKVQMLFIVVKMRLAAPS